MESRQYLDLDSSQTDAADAVAILEAHWDQYLEAVRRLEALPQNRTGADKSWVHRARDRYREHYRKARSA